MTDVAQTSSDKSELPRSHTGMPVLMAVTVCVGIGAGVGGMCLGLLLYFVQHWAYGYSIHTLLSTQSFLQGVSASTPERRVEVLFV